MPEKRDQNRDEEASALVRQALREFEGPLTGYAYSFVRDMETARDVVQDTFLKLYQQEPKRLKRGLKPWLYTVCRNRALDILRKEKRMISMEDSAWEAVAESAPDPGVEVERREAHHHVIRLVERLPANQREVIRLKFQGDMSYREISEVTELSVSNVGFLLHQGIKRLRELMAQEMDEGTVIAISRGRRGVT